MAVITLSGDQVASWDGIDIDSSAGTVGFTGVTYPFLATDILTITISDSYLSGDEFIDGIEPVFTSIVVTRDGIDYTLDIGSADILKNDAGQGDDFFVTETAIKGEAETPFEDLDTKLLFSNIPLPSGNSFTLTSESGGDDDGIYEMVCFVRGSEIETDRGLCPVEKLQVGDRVAAKDNGFQKIRWIGSRTVPAKGKLAPVEFATGSIGNAKPLRLSQQHRVLVSGWKVELYFAQDDVFTSAKHLVNGDTIKLVPGGKVEYFHILCDKHEVVYANGAPVETLLLGPRTKQILPQEQLEEINTIFPGLLDENHIAYASHPVLGRREVQLLH